MCSHVLSEVEGVCDDVVILSSGRMVASGSVADVLARARELGPRRDAVRVRVPASSTAKAIALLEPMSSVARMNGGAVGGLLEVELGKAPELAGSGNHHGTNKVLDVLLRADIPVIGFEIEGGRLQDAFLQLTEGERA
jgi:ABC-2 type transport system ATP-binding protein